MEIHFPFTALRVPAVPYAVFVGFVCGIAHGPCPHLARFQSFVLVSLLVMMTLLVATRCVAGERPSFGMLGCGAAAMVVTEAAFSYLFMKERLQAAAAQAAALGVFGFHALHDASAATVCKFVLCDVRQHAADASAAAFPCKSSVILLENEKSELPWSCAGLILFLQLCVAGKSGNLELVDNFLQFGKGKE